MAQHNEYRVLVVHEWWVGMYGVGGKNLLGENLLLITIKLNTLKSVMLSC